MKKACLTLENGRVFEGTRFGAETEAEGELVFTTGMSGYLETLTDPSYFGQIVVQTFPLIGNYGVISEDFESARPRLSGYIVREWCDMPSNFRSESDLDAYLKKMEVPGLYGVDTRALTRILRSAGVMHAKIGDTPCDMFVKSEPIAGVLEVTADAVHTNTPSTAARRVVLWDFGAKGAIEGALLSRGCEVVTFPATATAEEIIECKPDGIVLSNGPGDPAVNTLLIAEIGRLTTFGTPIFGICLGHQLLALSQGASTHKLPFGHRGANQPAQDIRDGRIYITSQNHGYAVMEDTLPDGVEVLFVNANDESCEGLAYRHFPAFSVQFHPEACGGPLDTAFLFDDFLTMMGGNTCR